MYNQNSGELVFHLWGQPSSKLVTTKEEGVERIFRIHNMYYPVGISVEQTSPLRGFPWVKPSDMIASMARTRDLHHLLAGHDLQNAESKLVSFWTKYRALHPQHELWAEIDNGRKSYARCLPLLLHGDEGVSFKRNGILVVSFQSYLGHGSSKTAVPFDDKDRLPINFLQTGFQTRILICVCQKDCFVVEIVLVSSIQFWVDNSTRDFFIYIYIPPIGHT